MNKSGITISDDMENLPWMVGFVIFFIVLTLIFIAARPEPRDLEKYPEGTTTYELVEGKD